MDENEVLNEVLRRHGEGEDVLAIVEDIRRQRSADRSASGLNAHLKKMTVWNKQEKESIAIVLNAQTPNKERLAAYNVLSDHFLEMYRKVDGITFKKFLVQLAFLDERGLIASMNSIALYEEWRDELKGILRQSASAEELERKLDQFVYVHQGFPLPSATVRWLGGARVPLHQNGLVTKHGRLWIVEQIVRDKSCHEYGHRLLLRSVDDDEYISIPHSMDRQNIRTDEVFYDPDGDECTAYGGYWTWKRGCKAIGQKGSACKQYIKDKWAGEYPAGHPKLGMCRELESRSHGGEWHRS